MIESVCTCGQPISLPESDCPSAGPCPTCGTPVHLTSAEPLTPGAGAGDFDAQFVVERGPHDDRIGHLYLLGGVAPITLGKLSTSNILLPGTNVSRHHATLTRLDFGPSRWQIADHQSTNGLWINDQRVEGAHHLHDNDLVLVGDYELRFRHAAEPAPVMASAVPDPAARRCPSCAKPLGPKATICTDCGIYTDTGKPLITSRGFDENEFEIRASNWIRVVSWFIPLGFSPIASEALGTKKPYAIWSIAALTIVISVWFFFAHTSDGAKNLMLWSGDPAAGTRVAKLIDQVVDKESSHRTQQQRDQLEQLKEQLEAQERQGAGEFHSYQLLTHAFLHGGIMHLAGNLVFLLILGSRVNALIGNLKTAILYPILAVVAGLAHHLAMSNQPVGPALGASGAIMGLAGMYLVLFPVNRVHMAVWFRLGPFLLMLPFTLLFFLRFFFIRVYKFFPIPGIFVVLFYIVFDAWHVLRGGDDGTAHWAHLGGFVAGVAAALILLLTRQVDARGGDLLSVTLGRHAWALIGNPASRAPALAPDAPPPPPVPAVHATSLNFPE